MNILGNLLQDPTTTNAVITVLGTVWTLVKGSAWWERRQMRKERKIARYAARCVKRVYEGSVRSLKAAAHNGKLSVGQRQHVHGMAVHALRQKYPRLSGDGAASFIDEAVRDWKFTPGGK